MISVLFNNRFAETLGWTLIHSLWQLALLAILIAGLLKLLNRAKPQLRYLISCAGLLLMLLIPAITYFSLLPPAPVTPQPALHTDQFITHDASPTLIVLGQPNPHPQSAISRLRNALAPWLPIAVTLYALGASLMLVRLIVGYTRIKTLIAQGQPLQGPIPAQLSRLAKSMGVNKLINVIQSSLVEVPTLIGAFKPVILIPASALTGLPADQLNALLAHEIAHIRRHDYLVNLIQSVIETLLFHHPAVWWLSSRIRAEREFCCDDAAITAASNPIAYARALTHMETLRAPQNLALAAAGGSLLLRVRRILRQPATPSRNNLQNPGAAAILLILIGALCIFAFNRPTSAIEHAKKPTTLPAHSTMPHVNPDAPLEPTVLITLKIVEINDEKFAKLKLGENQNAMLVDAEEEEKNIDKLIKAKEATLISAPKILAVDGQSAMLFVGQQVPLIKAADSPDKKFDVKYDDAGIRFDAKPTIKGELITLEMEFSISKLMEKGVKGNAGNDTPQVFPVIEERKFKTGVQIQNGATALIASKSSEPGKTNIFFIHAKKVEPGEVKELIQHDQESHVITPH